MKQPGGGTSTTDTEAAIGPSPQHPAAGPGPSTTSAAEPKSQQSHLGTCSLGVQPQPSADLHSMANALLTASGSVEWSHLLEYAGPDADNYEDGPMSEDGSFEVRFFFFEGCGSAAGASPQCQQPA